MSFYKDISFVYLQNNPLLPVAASWKSAVARELILKYTYNQKIFFFFFCTLDSLADQQELSQQ